MFSRSTSGYETYVFVNKTFISQAAILLCAAGEGVERRIAPASEELTLTVKAPISGAHDFLLLLFSCDAFADILENEQRVFWDFIASKCTRLQFPWFSFFQSSSNISTDVSTSFRMPSSDTKFAPASVS